MGVGGSESRRKLRMVVVCGCIDVDRYHSYSCSRYGIVARRCHEACRCHENRCTKMEIPGSVMKGRDAEILDCLLTSMQILRSGTLLHASPPS